MSPATTTTSATDNSSPIPVTLLSGFLGSGKTTLLKHILHNKEGLRVAVIVNEITEENIDAYALGGTKLLQQEEKFVEVSSGCICCTKREDLIQQLGELASEYVDLKTGKEVIINKNNKKDQQQEDAAPVDMSNLCRKYDYILIESSGISEPMQVAQTFFLDIGDGSGSLNKTTARIDTCVTVVDASNILDRLQEGIGKVKEISAPSHTHSHEDGADHDHHHHHDHEEEENKEQSIGQLTLEQLEFANVVIVNKIDKLAGDDDKLKTILSTIKQINPLAEVIACQQSSIPSLKSILGTGKCTIEFAESVMGWMTDPPETHVPETEEYGIRNLVFRSDLPFHPKKLHTWLNSLWEVEEDVGQDEEFGEDDDDDDVPPGTCPLRRRPKPLFGDVRKNRKQWYGGEIFRIKGFLWLGNPSRVFNFVAVSGAGDSLVFQIGGDWMQFPARSGPGMVEQEPCQRLAFLGQNLDKEKLIKDLEGLLLTHDEYDQLRQVTNSNNGEGPKPDLFEDPFIPWELDGAEDEEYEEFEEEEEEEEDEQEPQAQAQQQQTNNNNNKKNNSSKKSTSPPSSASEKKKTSKKEVGAGNSALKKK